MTLNDDFIHFCCLKQKIQTSLSETLTTNYRKFDPKATPSQNISRNFTSADYGKPKEKKDNLRTPAKSTVSESFPKVGW